MKFLSRTTNNNGINIHYVDSINCSDTNQIPILICPGLSETAEEYYDLLEYLLPRRGIVFSFRGRGKSDTPLKGYNLYDHITDIETVIKETGLEKLHLFGISRGVSYALGFAQGNENQIKSIIVNDYPPEHRKMPQNWSDEYINNYLLPFNRIENIRPEAVKAIQSESTQIDLDYNSNLSVLVIRGLLEESLINEIDLERYKNMFTNLSIKEFSDSGHDIRDKEKELLYKTISDFLGSCSVK